MSSKMVLSSREAPAAIGPYSQAVRAGDWVHCSGQIGLDPATGVMVAGGVRKQTARALRNLGAVLKAAGLDFADVVKTTVFLADMSYFAEMNEAYAEVFAKAPPARSTVEAAALPKGALVEIEAVAFAGR